MYCTASLMNYGSIDEIDIEFSYSGWFKSKKLKRWAIFILMRWGSNQMWTLLIMRFSPKNAKIWMELGAHNIKSGYISNYSEAKTLEYQMYSHLMQWLPLSAKHSIELVFDSQKTVQLTKHSASLVMIWESENHTWHAYHPPRISSYYF